MTAPTHKQFSITWAALGALLLYLMEMTEINFYLSLIIMIQMGKVGALFPDLDHHWNNIKEKNALTWLVNKVLSITGAKHRSWQTHSLDIAILLTIMSIKLPANLYEVGILSNANKEVLSVILLGFMVGWLSHLFSDMLTPGGVRVLFFSRKTLEFVPRKLLGFSFSTGSLWEDMVFRVAQMVNIGVLIICVTFPIFFF
jgi:inner membrane protein